MGRGLAHIDRGGPAAQGITKVDENDFLFPQMTLRDCDHWTPGFTDYLYLSFTNATAFSPADAMPLSERGSIPISPSRTSSQRIKPPSTS